MMRSQAEKLSREYKAQGLRWASTCLRWIGTTVLGIGSLLLCLVVLIAYGDVIWEILLSAMSVVTLPFECLIQPDRCVFTPPQLRLVFAIALAVGLGSLFASRWIDRKSLRTATAQTEAEASQEPER